jgi:hypothetical protein
VTARLRRFGHALLHREEYRADPVTGEIYERCVRRVSGREMGVKVSAPGDEPNFQPVAP